MVSAHLTVYEYKFKIFFGECYDIYQITKCIISKPFSLTLCWYYKLKLNNMCCVANNDYHLFLMTFLLKIS